MNGLVSQPWLLLVLLVPLLGAGMILLRMVASREDERLTTYQTSRLLALMSSVATFLLSVFLFISFDADRAGYQSIYDMAWISEGIRFRLGIDGLSLPFIMLTTFITPLCVLISWNSIKERVSEYMVAFLLLETLIIGAFAAIDLVLFYLFFEATLLPMLMIVGIWGSKGERRFARLVMPSRIYAALKLFLYTFAGSVLMLVAICYIVVHSGTASIEALSDYAFSETAARFLWWGFFASFAVKLPMWPFHTWLPDAHVQAPTAGSVVLAALLLKLGGYGFLRISLPFFPEASQTFAPIVMALSVIAILYTSLVAYAQQDMKKLIAYTSVAHMGFVTMGIFSMNAQGIEGAVFQMISHGLISAALFCCVGILYERAHSRDMAVFGGVYKKMPLFAFLFLLFTMGNVGLPGTSGFVGEFLSLIGAFLYHPGIALAAALGIVLSAMYGLRLYKVVMLGEERTAREAFAELSITEVLCLGLLAIMVIVAGFFPDIVGGIYSSRMSALLLELGVR